MIYQKIHSAPRIVVYQSSRHSTARVLRNFSLFFLLGSAGYILLRNYRSKNTNQYFFCIRMRGARQPRTFLFIAKISNTGYFRLKMTVTTRVLRGTPQYLPGCVEDQTRQDKTTQHKTTLCCVFCSCCCLNKRRRRDRVTPERISLTGI